MDLDDPSSAPPLVAATTTFGGIVTSEPVTKAAPSGRELTRLTLATTLGGYAAVITEGGPGGAAATLRPGDRVSMSGSSRGDSHDDWSFFFATAINIGPGPWKRNDRGRDYEMPGDPPAPTAYDAARAFSGDVRTQGQQHHTTRYLQSHGITPQVSWADGYRVCPPSARSRMRGVFAGAEAHDWHSSGTSAGRRRIILDAAFVHNESPWALGQAHAGRKVIFVDRPIDALAYRQLRGGDGACFIALGRGWTKNPDRLRKALAQLPSQSRLVDGFSRDSLSPREGAPSALLQACAGARGAAREAPPDRTWADAVLRQQQQYIRDQGLTPYQPLGLRIVR